LCHFLGGEGGWLSVFHTAGVAAQLVSWHGVAAARRGENAFCSRDFRPYFVGGASAAQLIFAEGIGSTHVEKKKEVGENHRAISRPLAEYGEIFLASAPSSRFKVQFEGGCRRVVVLLVNGKSEDRIIVAENVGSAIAVMDAGIYTHNTCVYIYNIVREAPLGPIRRRYMLARSPSLHV